MITYLKLHPTTERILFVLAVILAGVLFCGWHVFAVRIPAYRAKQAFLKRVEEQQDCTPLKEQETLSSELITLNPELNRDGGYRRGYYKDSHCVYQGDWWVLRGADVNTIQSDGPSYAHDAYAVFSGSTYMEMYDADTFDTSSGWIKDKNGIYANDKRIEGLDPKTFSHISGYYYRDKNGVYFIRGTDTGISVKKVDDIDVETLMVVNDSLAYDARHVYFDGTILEDADPRSLKKVGGDYHSYYVQTNTHVFFMDEIVDGADSATFAYIGELYAKDAQHVYYLGVVVPDADPETFSSFGISYVGKDNKHIYLEGHRLVKSEDNRKDYLFDLEAFDLRTLELLSGSIELIRDKDGVYIKREGYFGRAAGLYVTAVAGKSDRYVRLAVDADTFTEVGGCAGGIAGGTYFYKDKSRVYIINLDLLTVKSLDADVSSFTHLGMGSVNGGVSDFFARDKDYLYRGCDAERMPVASTTFVSDTK